MSEKVKWMGLLMALIALACAGVQPQARFVVADIHGDDGCTSVFDYCVTVRCVVKNDSDVAGPVNVGFQLGRSDGTWITASEYMMLNPRQPYTFTHDFKEAQLGDEARIKCTAERAQ